MKKYILLVSILFASCDMPIEEVKGFGFWLGDENETFVAGPSETTDLYNKFIDAHNQKDMETIESMLSEDIVRKTFSNWHDNNPKIIGGSKEVDYDIFRYRQLSRKEVMNYE